MGSSRLPGKVLRRLGSRCVIDWVLRAAGASPAVDEVLVATTTDTLDDQLADHCIQAGASVHRGETEDVLSRFVGALRSTEATTIVRLTADCPLLDPALISGAVTALSVLDVDYLSTMLPRTIARGLDVEVVRRDALLLAHQNARGYERVHVTPYVHLRPDEFRLAGLTFLPRSDDLRITLDTEEDAVLLDAVVEYLGDGPHDWRTVVGLLRDRPEVAAINAGVRQKDLEEG